MTPEQERALAIARARKRKAEASGQAPAQAAPASPFLQRASGMLPEGTQPVFPEATPPQMRASLPPATEPDRLQNRTDSAGLAKLRKVEADIADATRKARVAPVDRRAAEAGQTATMGQLDGMSPLVAGMGGANAAQIAGLSAGEQVYNEAGVMGPSEARDVRRINSMAFGIPAMVNEDVRNQVGMAGRDRPGESLLGDLEGYLIPGELAFNAGRAGYNATVKPIVNALLPQGASAGARTTRLGARGVEQAGAWAGQNALMQGTVGASTAAAEEGRPVTMADIGSGLMSGATDPLNLIGPTALMGANRILTFMRSGGTSTTPANIAQEVSAATGGRADTAETAASQILDMEQVGPALRPQAISRVVRELEAGGLSRENVTRLFQAVQQRLSSLPSGQASRLTLGQALTEALERDFPQAAENILGTLRERRLTTRKGDRSPGIAGQVSRELRESQTGFLEDSAANLSGDQTAGVRGQMQAAREELGTQYENLFDQMAGQPVTEDLTRALDFYGTKGDLMRPLRMIADGQMINLDDMIRNDPRRAAHWLQSAAREQAEQAAARGDNAVARAYRSMRDNLLNPLQANAPGYQNVRSAYGSVEEIDAALDAGRRFLTRSERPGDLAEFMGELDALSPEARSAALASIRDEIVTMLGRAGEEAPARISQLTSANALRTLESLGAEGQALADDLRFLAREQRFLNSFDPNANSRTALNAQAISGAQSRGNSPMANLASGMGSPGTVTQDAIISGVVGQPIPIMTAKKGVGAVLERAFGPRIRTLEDQTRFYMSRAGNVPGAPRAPDFTGPRSAPTNALSSVQGNEGGPIRATVGKPKRDIGTRVTDATAIAALGIAPPAEGQSGDGAELQAANERVRVAGDRVLQIEKTAIPKLEGMLEKLQDPNGDPKEKQRVLIARGHNLGTFGPNADGVDGDLRPGGYSATAIAAEQKKIEREIVLQRQELDKARKEVDAAREGVTKAQMRQSLADAEVNPYFKTGSDLASGAAFLGGIYLAGRARKGAVKEYSKAAKVAATKANMLLNRGQLYPKANVGPNSTNVRASNLNEFWKQGGAKSRVPFKADDQGEWAARKNAKEPSKLFKAPRFIDNDQKFIIATGLESQATKYAADHFSEQSEKAQADMDRAYAAGDSVAFDAAVKRRNMADGGEAFFRILERLGYGLAAGRTLSGLKKYPAVNANIKAAEAERALILQGLQKQKAISAKANNPNGQPKP